MGSMSVAHWVIVLVIALLVFGPKRLASLGKGMGEGIRSFREGLAGDDAKPEAQDKAIEKDKSSQPPRDQTTS